MNGGNFHRATSDAQLSPTSAAGFTGIRSKILSLSSIQAVQCSQTSGPCTPHPCASLLIWRSYHKTDVRRRMVHFLKFYIPSKLTWFEIVFVVDWRAAGSFAQESSHRRCLGLWFLEPAWPGCVLWCLLLLAVWLWASLSVSSNLSPHICKERIISTLCGWRGKWVTIGTAPSTVPGSSNYLITNGDSYC